MSVTVHIHIVEYRHSVNVLYNCIVTTVRILDDAFAGCLPQTLLFVAKYSLVSILVCVARYIHKIHATVGKYDSYVHTHARTHVRMHTHTQARILTHGWKRILCGECGDSVFGGTVVSLTFTCENKCSCAVYIFTKWKS